MTPSGYITHTVSAPSLHGKTVRLTEHIPHMITVTTPDICMLMDSDVLVGEDELHH